MRARPAAAPRAVVDGAVLVEAQEAVRLGDGVEVRALLVIEEEVGQPDGLGEARVQYDHRLVGEVAEGEAGVPPLLTQEDGNHEVLRREAPRKWL